MKRKAPRRRHDAPKVVVRKLGREKVWGLAHLEKNTIEIDPRLTGLAKLEILIHEWTHLHSWAASEEAVTSMAKHLSGFLHKHNVRIIESGDKPLK